MTRLPMLKFRRSPGEVLDRVRLRDEAVTLERAGRAVAVIISPERYARLQAAAAREANAPQE